LSIVNFKCGSTWPGLLEQPAPFTAVKAPATGSERDFAIISRGAATRALKPDAEKALRTEVAGIGAGIDLVLESFLDAFLEARAS
jgi:hypothetical protein